MVGIAGMPGGAVLTAGVGAGPGAIRVGCGPTGTGFGAGRVAAESSPSAGQTGAGSVGGEASDDCARTMGRARAAARPRYEAWWMKASAIGRGASGAAALGRGRSSVTPLPADLGRGGVGQAAVAVFAVAGRHTASPASCA